MEKIIELTEENICKICENQLGKYTCPRCNIFYCTLKCYQSEKHIECSENFYQKCVEDELKSEGNSAESKAKMLEILKRFHEKQSSEIEIDNLDSDDDEPSLDIAERLKDIDLNDVQTVWKLLTADERQEFEALISSKDVSKIIPIWSPWWEIKIPKKLIQEVSHNQQLNNEKDCPEILTHIKSFEEITKVKPANCVKYNLLNVLGAYCCIVRYFNGDHFDFAKEAVFLITNLSKNLHQNENYESFNLALESVHQQILANDWITSDSETKHTMYKDIKNITQGPEKENKMFYIKCALSDLFKLLLFSKKNCSVENDNDFSKRFKDQEISPNKIVSKEKLKVVIRKIEYYLSYVTTFNCDFT